MAKKILIVEDEAINAISLRMALKRLGYTFCELVSTGEQAVRVAEQKNPEQCQKGGNGRP